jgi:hypothetical protein
MTILIKTMLIKIKNLFSKLVVIPVAIYETWYGYYSHSKNRYKELKK